MVIENVMGERITNARIQIATHVIVVIIGRNIKVAADSMLHLKTRQPKDLVTAIEAIVRKSAYAIQFRNMAEYL